MRSRLLVAAAIVLASIGLAGCLGDPSPDRFAPSTSTTTETRTEARDAEPVQVEGDGPATRTVSVQADGPVVVRSRVRSGQRLVAVIRSTRYELLLFDRRAPGRDTAAAPAPGAGSIELDVRTPGPWSLVIEQPRPSSADRPLPGVLSGRGSAAIPVQATDGPPRAVVVSHRGAGRFVASLFAYDEFAMGVDIYAGRGKFSHRVALTQAIRGPYLLSVRTGGRWTLRFLAE